MLFKLSIVASFAFLIYSLFPEPGKPTPQDKADALERNWKHTPAKEQTIIVDTDVDSIDIINYYSGIYDSILIQEHKFPDSMRVEYRRQVDVDEGKDTVVILYHKRFRSVFVTKHRELTAYQFYFYANNEPAIDTSQIYTAIITYDKSGRDTSGIKKFVHWVKGFFR